MSADSPRPGREVAYRIFAAEFDDASLSHADSDEERAPNYVIAPTGARLNRVFVVGTLTEVTDVNEEMVRARVVDPTGAVVMYAGQYQPDALAFLEAADPPTFVAVTGKARTFEPDDGDRVYSSIRPETLSTVDAETSQRWVVETAEQTLERIGTYASAATLDVDVEDLEDVLRANGVSPGLAAGIPLAMAHYGTTPGYLGTLRETALDAVRVVAGDRTEARRLDRAPDSHAEADPTFATLAESYPTFDVPERLAVSTQVSAAEEPTDSSSTDEPTASTQDPDSGAAIGTASGSMDRTDDPGDFDPTATEVSASETDTPETDSPEAVESGSDVSDESGTDGSDIEGGSDIEDGSGIEDGSTDATTETATVDGESDSSTPTPTDAEDTTPPDGDASDADGTYEMAEEEREAVEAEYGTEFSTGAEVDPPGEADIDVEPADSPPESDEESPGEDESGGAATGEAPEPKSADTDPDTPTVDGEPTASDAAEDPDEPTGDADEDASDAATDEVDLQSVVVETMAALDEGDGAERTAIVESVIDETGAGEDAVEDAIQDALMDGECFEPAPDRFSAI